MRWFKHVSNARLDAGILQMSARLSRPGNKRSNFHLVYATFFQVLELICQYQIAKDDFSCTLPIAVWCRELRVSPEFLRMFAGCSAEILRMNWEFTADTVRVSHPKLLKYRDEYSRKSGHTPDSPVAMSATEYRCKRIEEEIPIAPFAESNISPPAASPFDLFENSLADTELSAQRISNNGHGGKAAERSAAASRLLDLWNRTAGLPNHSRSPESHLKQIGICLSKWTEKEIGISIERYAIWCLNADRKYRDAYHWSCAQFVRWQQGANIERLSADAWEQCCIAWAQPQRPELNARRKALIRALDAQPATKQ